MSEAEQAINQYFQLLNNPDALLDDEAIEKAAKRIKEAETPVARLLARQEYADLQVPDIDGITSTFTEHVKDWAEANNVSVSILLSEGVPADVLKSAGMETQVKAAERTVTPPEKKKHKRTRVKGEEVRNFLMRRRSPDAITILEVCEATGVTSAPARRIMYELIDEGVYVEAGVREEFGPGRAPMTYRKA